MYNTELCVNSWIKDVFGSLTMCSYNYVDLLEIKGNCILTIEQWTFLFRTFSKYTKLALLALWYCLTLKIQYTLCKLKYVLQLI